MRSTTNYIVTKDQVYGYASDWLMTALKLEYHGTKCTGNTVVQVLLLAASRVVSVFAACRDLADAPCDQTIRNALGESLPEMRELEKRLNCALATNLPKSLRCKARMIAIDLTLIPYHGQPLNHEKEIYRSLPKSGTTHFHAYASAVVVNKGHRYTLALTHVEKGETMKEIVKRLLAIVRRRDVKIKYLLLDKGFFSIDVIAYLKRAGRAFVIPAVARGRKPKPGKPAKGLRALMRKKHGFYEHTMAGTHNGKRRTIRLKICVASKHYVHRKNGKRRRKSLMYAISNVKLSPKQIRETYRKRFGIETSYRQMNEARIPTCTRDPRQRLLFVAIALILRNVWVWLHFKLAKNKNHSEPRLFLELLRFNEMLLWITQIVQRHLGANQQLGIDRQAYERLAAQGP